VTTGGTDKRGGLGARGGTGEVARVIERIEQSLQDKQVGPKEKGRGRSPPSPHVRVHMFLSRRGREGAAVGLVMERGGRVARQGKEEGYVFSRF
jgi:hypothetical protein